VESTYGDRLHDPDDGGARLATIINDCVHRNGRLIIPAFAIGRVEEVIFWIKRLEDEGRIPTLPVFVDSPMAAGALQFYSERLSELDPELARNAREVCGFCTTRMTIVGSADESRTLVGSRDPAIVVASSGMATGGRVLNHLAAGLPDPRNTVLFVGYQAAGTRGRLLCDGVKQIKMHGQMVTVAARIERIDSMSAHADRAEILRWLGGFSRAPSMTYLVHGEPGPLQALWTTIQNELGWPAHIAKHLEKVELDLR
jgi:metallo-beta-lactamase family protein